MSIPIVNLENEMIRLTFRLYNNLAIPRNVVQYFLDTLLSFINDTYMIYLQQQMQLTCKRFDVNIFNDIQAVIDSSKLVFEQLHSEHRRFKLYQEK